MEVQQNVLYVMTSGAYVRRDHLAVQVELEGEVRLGVPIHNLQAVVLMGAVLISPGALSLCAENGVSVTFLSEAGRLLARLDAPVSGNVLLRREQFRQADREADTLRHGRMFVAGKLHNARSNLLRSARDNAAAQDREALQGAAAALGALFSQIEAARSLDEVRGIEGASARAYFAVFPHMVRHDREAMAPCGRSRRPPRDRGNALLSFLYALLSADCIAALAGAGLDPNVGFLHTDRPGRPSLALDLMEEFRPMLADRLALTLTNRRQVDRDGFVVREGGAVEMVQETRKRVVAAWQERKQEEVTHPLLGQTTRLGMLPHLQARILARVIRGDLQEYVPCTLK